MHGASGEQVDRNDCDLVHRLESDKTKDVSFQTSATSVDFVTKSISITVAVKNESRCPIATPLNLVLESTETDFGGVSVSNADNRLKNEKAAWKLLTDRRLLAPGEQSEPHVIRWQFDGQVPESKGHPDIFIAHFKVLSGSTATTPKD